MTSILPLDKQVEEENPKGGFLFLSVCPVSINGKGTSLGKLGGGEWNWGRAQDPGKSRKEIGYGEAPSTSMGEAGKRLDSLKENLFFPNPPIIKKPDREAGTLPPWSTPVPFLLSGTYFLPFFS